jgi:CheY-like chemotaxis protein
MPKKILLADDSITIQKVVELTFSDGDYEVTAVNNGAKAIQKLAEMRPDIILSDIIMPEKNGYEVCEYVKSHPDYRSIPVVLLTGTFEPFDPDRAEKAGCDAVVTKPFESQSLIHKVEELISQAQAAPAAAAPAPAAPEPAASPWLDETPVEPPPAAFAPPPPPAPTPVPPPAPVSPFSTATEAVPALNLPFTHDSDIFGSAPQTAGSADLPFDTRADHGTESPFGAPPPAEEFSGETRAFPRMSFEEMQALASGTSAPQAPEPVPTVPPPAPEPSPWDEPADASPFAASPAPPAEAASPFNQEEFGGETRAFQKMDFEELNRFTPPPAAPPAPAPSEADSESPFGAPPPEDAFSGETRAFTKMSFEDLQQLASSQSLPAEPEPPAAPTPEPSPWDEPAEPPAYGGETRAFPKMSFEDLQAGAPAPEPAPWEQPAVPAWSSEPEPEPAAEETPFAATSPEPPAPVLEELPVPEAQPAWGAELQRDEPQRDMPQREDPQPDPRVTEPEPVSTPAAFAPASEPSIPVARDLTDEQVDRIARRVVELMSDQVVRNIAWEVIPDLAEMVVKERIRQLESEA